jgi:hypothetical protein
VNPDAAWTARVDAGETDHLAELGSKLGDGWILPHAELAASSGVAVPFVAYCLSRLGEKRVIALRKQLIERLEGQSYPVELGALQNVTQDPSERRAIHGILKGLEAQTEVAERKGYPAGWVHTPGPR